MEQKYTHTRILGGFSNAFSMLPLKSMKTQPRVSDESKYGEENIHIKAELEHKPAWRRCFPYVQHCIPAGKAQRVHRAGGPELSRCVSEPKEGLMDLLISDPVLISAGTATTDLPNVPSPLRYGF